MHQEAAIEQRLGRRARPDQKDIGQYPFHRRQRDQADRMVRQMHRHIGEHRQARKKPQFADHCTARKGNPGFAGFQARSPARAGSTALRPFASLRACAAMRDRAGSGRTALPSEGLLDAGDPSSGQTFRSAGRGRRCLVRRAARRGLGLSRPERRRQVDDDEDDHRLCRADRRHRDRLRSRHREGADRGQALDRLSARGRPRLSRHDAGRVSPLHRPYPRLCRPRGAAAHRPSGRDDPYRRGSASADRDPVEGLSGAGSGWRRPCCTTPRC